MAKRRAEEPSGEPAFLGTGWAFPPQFTAGGGDVAMVSGTSDVHESLRILLDTQLGERVMREDFGCDLSQVLFEEVSTALENRIGSLVRDAVLRYESRITLNSVDVTPDDALAGRLAIRLDYTVRGTNSRFNLVYDFYLQEPMVPGR